MKSGNTCADTGDNIGENTGVNTCVNTCGNTRRKTAVVVTILAGAFAVMAMSNAVVPVLNLLAKDSPQIQGIIYSAYFLGAFLTVLPAGMISDRVGRTLPIRAGLILTVVAGIAMILLANPTFGIAVVGQHQLCVGYSLAQGGKCTVATDVAGYLLVKT